MVRWAPLTNYLRDAGDERVELTYEQVGQILGGSLPPSATEHRPYFWTNSYAGGYGRHWMDAGYRVSLRGMPSDAVAFVRDRALDVDAPADAKPVRRDSSPATGVLLVGCVKSKAPEARPARELYTSDLFARRREFAESSGLPWVVLSAEYGAVDPDEVIEPYDRFLEEQPAAYRRQWAQDVIEQLEALYGPLDGNVFELHASRAYGDPIEPLLRARGATLLRPLDGLRFGQHLQWYSNEVPHKPVARSRIPERASPILGRRDIVVAAADGLAARITSAFVDGELDLSDRPAAPEAGWAGMPEVRAVERVRATGAGHVETRLFLTLVSAMDRARDADVLWDRGAEAFASARWLFDPRSVVRRSFTELLDALRTAGLSQRHATDVGAWRVICESLDDTAVAPAVGTALIDGRGDARVLLDAVQARSPAGTDRFPLLRGPKIRVMWIRILAYPGGATIDNLDVLPVAVDVQVRKVTENLNVTDTIDEPLEGVRALIQQTWARDVAEHGAAGPAPIADTSAALDPALWFYGKWGCTFCEGTGTGRPIHRICDGCRLMEDGRAPAEARVTPALEQQRQEKDTA